MKLSDFSGKQWRVLLILMLVNFVNYVDRQIVFSLFPSIRRDFALSYVQLGYLATAFTVVLSLASFPLGMLADRISRRAVISAGVLFWSGATFFSGLAGSFRALLMARGLVGIGEAAYTPAGAAVISASFPQEVRARVQGAFDMGMFIGGATGIALGGLIAASFGWRFAFFLVGIPGVVLGLTALRLPKSVASIAKESMPVRELLRVPAFLALLASGWFCSFAGYTYVAWGPELVQDYKGFSARQAGLALGLTIVLGGTIGIATGAYLSDLLAKLRSWGRAVIVPIGFVLGAPAIYFSLHASGKIHFLLFFGLGAFFLSWYHGPLTATIHDLVPPRGHATALGFYYLFVNLFSMAVAPVVIGRLADRYDLITALHIPIFAQLAGAAFFIVVIQCIRHDGLRHPVLVRHWDDAPCALAPGVALAFEET
ncbi:putative Arabinose efflux permease [Candidatus Sulfotelmatobacter kueseliae]|uniref:Putative Arabinose efflux permease n=1 Tax=Candidatus Sulfotelmatobacter kueseliae TaxID=2042962 RepID=A0A2U3KRX6_9BACT|nr:putative Arabinose efflux permease [Candidatus Sulfotelmatobacter kueseliae]